MSIKVSNRKIIIIVGPTASGKSGLAVKIAKKMGGEVVSADSRQIYKGLDIGTGKITKKEMAGIPHHLLDVANPKKVFTVVQYRKLALKAIQEIWEKGKIPILCGGTGFYIQSVIDGINIPEVEPNPRLRNRLNKKSESELFDLLRNKDSERAKTIDRKNKVRLIRALEIVEKLGKVPAQKQSPIDAEILMIGIRKTDLELRKLIHRRLIKRLGNGMVEEVRKLHRNGLSWKRLNELGLEYRYVAQFLEGQINKGQLIEVLDKEIRCYAKRQMTWFKRDNRIKWIAKTQTKTPR